MYGPDVHRQVARLHMENIDRGFLATLGEGFLTQLYAAIDGGDTSVLLVEEEGERVIGFVSGATGMSSIYKRMLRRPFALGVAMLPVVFSLSRLKRIFDILTYSGGSKLPPGVPDAELLSIAVAPEGRGRQVADRLYARLTEHFRANGVERFRIIVGAALEPAHRFYRRMGAEPVGEVQVHEGEVSVLYLQRVE